MSEIILRDICKSYENGFHAVKNFNLEIEKGELVVFVGPSGCGKSTTLRMIAGLEDISDGELWIGDKLVNYLEPKERDLAMVFQSYALYPQMNIYDNIAFSLQVRKVPKKEIDKRVHHVAELLGLENLLKQRPKNLSGGQRQRIGIARALATNPKFIICDEAVSALDVSIQAQVINMFEELQDKLGIAYLFIAHDLLVVHHISDRIAVMYLGRVVEIADADELNASPIHPYTQSLLSAVPYPDPKMAKERQRIILEGDVPSPLHMPTGCAFRTRCKYATEQCAKECPTLTDRGNGHQVACWNK